jgi:hypothetical protein
MDNTARLALSDILDESTAELLRLNGDDGETYWLLNVLSCCDCVDEDRTKWKTLNTGTRLFPELYEFVPDKVLHKPIFKSTSWTNDILLSQGLLPRQSEFKARVEDLGLTGMSFREVWNDDGDAVEPRLLLRPPLN